MDNTPTIGLRERKKQEVRERILAIAQQLFKLKGYSQTSMDEIAEIADISRKTLFNYMSTKEAILTELVDQLVRNNMPDWVETDAPEYHDVRDLIAPRLKERLHTIAQNRWLLAMAAEHTNYYNSIQSDYVDSALHSNFESRVRRVRAVQQEGKIRADIPPEEISNYYEALRDATIQRWLLTPNSLEADLHTAFDRAMKVLLRGLSVGAVDDH